MKAVLLIGQHGVGKTTLGFGLATSLGGEFISAGQILRRIASGNTPRSLFVRGRLRRGLGAPARISYGALAKQLSSIGENGFVVLDGFPREFNQIEALDRALSGPPIAVLHLHAPTVLLIDRIRNRAVCLNASCGQTFGPENPPNDGGTCSRCGSFTGRRDDDDEKALAMRHRVWTENGVRILDHYRLKGLVIELPAHGSSDAVLDLARGALQRGASGEEN